MRHDERGTGHDGRLHDERLVGLELREPLDEPRLEVARAHGDIQTIAFPCISTGIFGYPKDEAADIAVATIAAELAAQPLPAKVILCAYGREDADILREALEAAAG